MIFHSEKLILFQVILVADLIQYPVKYNLYIKL